MSRDLSEMHRQGLVDRVGDGRGTRYRAKPAGEASPRADEFTPATRGFMIEEVGMIRKAAFFAWMVCAVAACSSSAGTAVVGRGWQRRNRRRVGSVVRSARGRPDGGPDGAADLSGAGGFVSVGALDWAPGIYIVPAGPDTPEVRYPIDNPSLREPAAEISASTTPCRRCWSAAIR